MRVLLLLFQSGFLLFLFLLWLLWLKLTKLCWIVVVRVGTLVFFLILEEMLSVFHHWDNGEKLNQIHRFAVGLSCESKSRSVASNSLWILQARILEWVAYPFSRASSQPSDWTLVSHIVGRRFTVWAKKYPSLEHPKNKAKYPRQSQVDMLY